MVLSGVWGAVRRIAPPCDNGFRQPTGLEEPLCLGLEPAMLHLAAPTRTSWVVQAVSDPEPCCSTTHCEKKAAQP